MLGVGGKCVKRPPRTCQTFEFLDDGDKFWSECMKVKVICAHLLSNVMIYSVLDKAGEVKVLERYDLQNSEIKVEKGRLQS